MQPSVPAPRAERPKRRHVATGNAPGPYSPAVASAEGYVEALAAVRAEADALAEWIGILRLVGEQIIARRHRLAEVVMPEVQRGYRAAEAVVDLERARRARRRIVANPRVLALTDRSAA
ncbi:MAG: hypothetical protein JWM87_661 [Candidatus Eremiobacteraeota bacterium]|nr:hypothetical protein [Candidatus Eremiobacteraeota bacterium]